MKHCTQCGQEAAGRFCGACGATLKALPCPGCGTELLPGTRFCNLCGAPARATRGAEPQEVGARSAGPGAASGGGGDPTSGRLGWWISGGLLAVLVLIVLFSEFSGSRDPAVVGAPFSGTLGPAPNVDLSSMTPRQAADNLYNRVMNAIAQDNTTEATNFLPMAIEAYRLARPLDEDGLFHLSLLQRAAGDFEAALATALEGLEDNPDHLLNLSAAAESARELGDTDAATAHYTRMLEAWDREVAAARVEYEEHARVLPLIREDAETHLGGAGS